MAGGTPQDAVRCRDCGGETVGPFTLEGKQRVGLWPARRQRLFVFQGLPILVSACVDCGSVRLWAADPSSLREMARAHPDWFA
jgi:hypothetical protein